jgi:AcrR family transcriptional regulator
MSEAWPDDRLSQSRLRSDSERTRSMILHAAATLAAADGLGSISIGSLALAAGVSRAGQYALFGSEQELQLAIVDEAARIFGDEVVQPALAAPPGLAQLATVCEAFFRHLERRTLPGGCFMASAALEIGGSPGPAGERIAEFQSRFGALIRGFAATALARNELTEGEDPGQLAFELNGIMLAADTNFAEHGDPAVLDLARRIVRARLGISGG